MLYFLVFCLLTKVIQNTSRINNFMLKNLSSFLELLCFYNIKILSQKAKLCQLLTKSKMSYFIDKLKQIMETKGLTQQMLAKMGNVSNNTISKWLNGQTSPKVKNIEPLAKALNLTVGDLIGDWGNNESLTEQDKRFISLTPQRKTLLLNILDLIEKDNE